MMAASNDDHATASMFESHPSLSASLEDFEHHERPSAFRYPSHRSGFARSDTSEPTSGAGGEELSSSDAARWSPPPLPTTDRGAGSGWYRHQPYLDQSLNFRSSVRSSRSREASGRPRGSTEDDLTLPANIPLPRGSISPVKEQSVNPEGQVDAVNREESREKSATPFLDNGERGAGGYERSRGQPVLDNYIRFSLRADMQHRADPFDTAVTWLSSLRQRFARSPASALTSLLVLLVSLLSIRALTRSPYDATAPAPDLVKIAGLTRSFEPLIYYSENGVSHVTDLQETGIAVWDLGESVRAANMSGSDAIVAQLDSLAESLKALGTELTRFFASVDGDIDNILLVMDWARRELSSLSATTDGQGAPSFSLLSFSPLSSALANAHDLFARSGLITDPATGRPNRAGAILASLLGATPAQRTRQTLQRTFVHLLQTLEQSIEDEIVHTTRLFALFAMIDAQFANLQRTTVRELDSQEQAEGELLSSLWQRVVGGNASRLRKFEKNKRLLRSVRQRTVANKLLVVDHDRRLKALQQNLEVLRQRLVKPVIHETEGSSVGVEEQIRGLEGTYDFLRRVREEQKGRVLEKLYGSGSGSGRRVEEIDGS